MISAGLKPGVLVRYTERDEQGESVFDPVYYPAGIPPGGWPAKFDLEAFGGLSFIIHKHFSLGGQFSYSLTKVRGPRNLGVSRLNGEYNNVINLRFTYILDTVKKKKG
jgi:hypothetical protein